MRRKAFTLIELLVVVAIIALLVSILLPALNRARELAKRGVCGTNIKNIGTAMTLYKGGHNDQYPWIGTTSTAWDATKTGQARDTDYVKDEGTARSITSLLFLLVRDKQSPNLFICPSRSDDVVDGDTQDSTKNNAYRWDFKEAKNVSYSYAAPITEAAKTTSGATDSADPMLVIMSDKNPFFYDGNAPAALTDTTTGDDLRKHMSQNHTSGEYINYLFQDTHVGGGNRPDVGLLDPNGKKGDIYTASADSTKKLDLQGGTQITVSSHVGIRDAFVIGPAKP